ncbi:MAG: DNA modification methylase [Syntrophales bacterium]|nr:DNA modification methylase [Syntrophales bacterium]
MLEIQEIEIDKVQPWEENPRQNDHAVAAIAESIRHFGFNVPILCDQDLTIIAGHTRWKAAKKLELEAVPVIVVEMTSQKRRAFAIADNKLAELADWDFPKLRTTLEALQHEDIDMQALGFSDAELKRLLSCYDNEEDSIPDVTETTSTIRSGDLFILGNHRLLCGDCRNTDLIAFLSRDIQVNHVFGGPPYFNQRSYAHWDDYDSYLEDMSTIIANCFRIMHDGAVCVWNIANGCSTHHDHVGHHSRLFEQMGFRYLDTIIWKKTGANYAIPRNFHIKRNSIYYPALEWEALLVYQKSGKMPKMTRDGRDYMSKYHTDVWEVSAVTNQMDRFGHPAVCPVEIPYRSIQAYTGNNDIIFEPFGGSGTTMIAAEKAGRRALATEINPLYCDMIIKRWETLTGDKAIYAERFEN